MYKPVASQIINADAFRDSLIIQLGRNQAATDSLNQTIEQGEVNNVEPCVSYLVVAPSIESAVEAIKTHLPEVYAFAVAEAQSNNVKAVAQALENSWSQFSAYCITSSGNGIEGAATLYQVLDYICPQHLELIGRWLNH